MKSLLQKMKFGYPYPLGYPIQVVMRGPKKLSIVGWLYQRYSKRAKPEDILISERIIEFPLLEQWFGSSFKENRVTALEIGHVASSVALELASLGHSVTGIDLRPYPFAHPNLTSLVGDFLRHNFRKMYDCIYSISTIEHFGFTKRYDGKEDADNSLDEDAFRKIAELLKPTGVAIVSMPYCRTLVPSTWFRIYTRETLSSKLSKYFKIKEQRFFKRIDNQWTEAKDHSEDPVSARDGVAMFLLAKP